MLRQVMTGAALLLVGSAASAADFETNPAGGLWIANPAGSAAAVSITQNDDTTTIDGLVSVACGVGGVSTADNQYLRRFFLNADHGIVDQFTVESVDFATSQLDGGSSIIVDVNIYSIASGDAFTYANMTLLANAPTEITAADVGGFTNAVVGGVFADPVGTDLVMEISSPDLSDLAIQHRVGANGNGATQDAYLASATCGINDPTPVGAIGFPDSQFIMIVNGDEEGTVPTEDATWSEVKSLF